MNRHEIGNRLLNTRNAKGLSRAEVASKADIGTTTLQQWETGSREASIETIAKLALIYQVSPQYLIFGDTDTPSAPTTDPNTSINVEQAIDTLKNLIQDNQPKLTEDETYLLQKFRTLSDNQKQIMIKFLIGGFDKLNNTIVNSPNAQINNRFGG